MNLFTGFEGYLVGGCVRDLLLNRKPKDFDVITTANLSQVFLPWNSLIVVLCTYLLIITCDAIELSICLILQIKKQFHRCVIVGRRFPICRVHIKGSVIEVGCCIHSNFCIMFYDTVFSFRYPVSRPWQNILKIKKSFSFLKYLKVVTNQTLIFGRTPCIVTSLLTGIFCYWLSVKSSY